MGREQHPRLFSGADFFEDSFAPMPAGSYARRILISDQLKAARASTDKLLDDIDTTLSETPAITYEAPPDEPRRPERYKHLDEMPITLRIIVISVIDQATGQFFEPQIKPAEEQETVI